MNDTVASAQFATGLPRVMHGTCHFPRVTGRARGELAGYARVYFMPRALSGQPFRNDFVAGSHNPWLTDRNSFGIHHAESAAIDFDRLEVIRSQEALNALKTPI